MGEVNPWEEVPDHRARLPRVHLEVTPGGLLPWLLSGAGLALLHIAGAAWWAVAASLVLLVAATRLGRDPALLAWVPPVLGTPLVTLFSWSSLGLAAGVLLLMAAWWPVRLARALVPLAGGVALVVMMLGTQLAVTLAASDIATGAQAAVMTAGVLLGYALLVRGGAEQAQD